MMHDDKLRAAIIAKLPDLPPVFSAKAVTAAIGEKHWYTGNVRRVLSELWRDGLIFPAHVMNPHRIGGNPSLWSALPGAGKQEVEEQAILSAIARLPKRFKAVDVVREAGMPPWFGKIVVAFLERMQQRGETVKIPVKVVGRPGTANSVWTTDLKEVAEVIEVREKIRQQREQNMRERKAVLDRTSKPWDS